MIDLSMKYADEYGFGRVKTQLRYLGLVYKKRKNAGADRQLAESVH
ncbi:hypothetical protein HZ993_18310 [Rhodoferax sp. AJA081-3]|nr:hypothetical protein [Rhodoferax sp. AJA081-3]QTN27228.1 hypothetical protein HZ993_18310 [Rhodoferax sp. AJA081-3]